MILKYFYDKSLAQASYMVGCAKTGEALVIDPSRDVTPYLEAAEAEGLRITHVTETHIHADYVSGTRELSAQTGATMYISDMGDENWKYAFADDHTVLLREGDWWKVGNVRIDVMHTPGHTPEHIVFQITDTAASDHPIGIFTGDFLFVGDVGRPDLLDEAAGFTGTREIGARQQFANIQRFKNLPGYLQIWPGHGAGSACGKALGSIPSTTLGYEKMINPAFQINDEDEFVNWLLDGQPEAPRYFAQMKKVNKEGPVLLENIAEPQAFDRQTIDSLIADNALVIDTRPVDQYAAGHLTGTLNVPETSGSFATWSGWFVDYDASVYLVTASADVQNILQRLRAIGVDHIGGYYVADNESAVERLDSISAPELAERMKQNGVQLIDVRAASDYQAQRIPGAQHIPVGYLPRYLDTLPRDKEIVLQCVSGVTSQVGASLLMKHGFEKIRNLKGGINAWRAADLPVEET